MPVNPLLVEGNAEPDDWDDLDYWVLQGPKDLITELANQMPKNDARVTFQGVAAP
jgi:hypothetical protein